MNTNEKLIEKAKKEISRLNILKATSKDEAILGKINGDISKLHIEICRLN